jgi:hypothetical protein
MPRIGIGLGLGLFGGGASFDTDAQAFFDRITTAGGTLSATEKTATNQLVLDMKSAGIWTPMKAIYPMVGASASACAQNLKSSSFTGSFTSGWTFASTGVTPNGTSAYMDTTLVPNTTLSQNSSHISFYSRTNIDLSCVDIGVGDSSGTNGLFILYYNAVTKLDFSRNNNNTGSSSSVTSSLGFIQNKRTTSTNMKIIRNNLTAINNTNATTGLSTNSIFVGARNIGFADFFSPRQCAFASIGDGLDDTQASNFYTAVQAFQTTLSRQV